MKTAIKKFLYNALFAALAIAIVFAVWHIFAVVEDNKFIAPSIPDTFAAFGTVLRRGYFWRAVGGTLLRCTIGFAIALALTFAVYVFSASFTAFRRLVEPFVSVMRSLPAVAVTILLVITVGGKVTPIVLGVLVIFPIMYSAAKVRTATIPRELKDVCVLLGASKWQTLKALHLPLLAGGLPESMASAYSYNIKAVVGAEILAQTADSLGMLMSNAQAYLRVDMLVAYVITSVALAMISEAAIYLALKPALKKYCD